MHKRLPLMMAALLGAALLLPALLAGAADTADKESWKPLFNGKDLSGWDSWLGKPAGEKEAIGLNKDPRKVYSIVTEDGQPAIRISGEVFGALTSKDEFENYHLKLQFKWGEKKWPPRADKVRDSGLLYHSYGQPGAVGGLWMRSLECQIQEHDCGDFYSVGGPIVDVVGTREDSKKPIVYKKGGELFKDVTSRIIRDVDHEKKHGEWNTIELLAVGDTSVHIVNGKANMVLTNIRRGRADGMTPLRRGKIQLQSEGAEVFYRGIAVRPLEKVPDSYLK